MRRYALPLVVLTFVVSSLSAATMQLPSDADLTRRADLVVAATVESHSVRIAGTLHMTDHRLVVDEVLKGNLAMGETIVVSEYGGELDGRGTLIPGSAIYLDGDRVLAFLRQRGDGTYYTANMGAGRFRIEGGLAIRDFDETTDAFPAEAFAKHVRDLVGGIDSEAPAPSNARLGRPQANANASDYVLKGGSPVKPVRWRNCEDSALCDIDFAVNGAQAGVDSSAGVSRARAAWESEPNSGIDFRNTGATSISAPANDDDSVVLLGYTGPLNFGLCDGTDACAIIYFGGTHTYKGEEFYNMVSFDVAIRAQTISQTKFDGLLTHEFGHALALRHSNAGTPSSTNAIMNSTISSSAGANLRTWDREAVATVYGNGLPCTAPEVTDVSGGGTIPSGSTRNLSVTATGSDPLTYQWYEGAAPNTSTPVGSNSSSFRTPELTRNTQYWVKVSNACGSAASETISITIGTCNAPAIATQPPSQRILTGQTATMTVTFSGTSPITFSWYEATNVGDTSKPVGTNSQTFTTPALTATTSYWVRLRNSCGSTDSALITITVGTACVPPSLATIGNTTVLTGAEKGPSLIAGATGDTPFTYQWYEGSAPDTAKPIAGATTARFDVPGPFLAVETRRYWVRVTNACGTKDSNTAEVAVLCGNVPRPRLSAPPTVNFARGYKLTWTGFPQLTARYEIQEATNAAFNNPRTLGPVTGRLEFDVPPHTEITTDTRFFYRVRAITACNNEPTEWSEATTTVVLRPQSPNSTSFSGNVPFGAGGTVEQDVFIPGFNRSAAKQVAGVVDTFKVTADQPWITVNPSTGQLPPNGITVKMTMNANGLPSGASMGTLAIERFDGAPTLVGIAGNTKVNVPITISLVTPVSSTPRTSSANDLSLIIPSIGHVDGFNSRFQSDVRVANTSGGPLDYLLTYTPSNTNGTEIGKQTLIRIESGETKGLNDIVKDWYGAGVAGEAGLGALEIKPVVPNGVDPASLSRVTAASSRTYNISSTGTFGQYIPAFPASSFIARAASSAASKISLQQIAWSSAYRTNLGFVEGAGEGAQIMVSLFDANGRKLREVLMGLQPFEQRQMSLIDGSLFPGVNLNDGRVEVQVVSDTGRVSAFASVLDNQTSDPLLVFPVQPAQVAASRFVLPGVAELDSGAANFRTDMRIYNAAETNTRVAVHYYPRLVEGRPSPAPIEIVLAPGEVRSIDNTLRTLWNISGSGGAVAVVPDGEAPVVVTGRTFSRNASNGTFGQFIPAVSANDAVGENERSLEVVQLEDSPAYRTNVGLLEVTGQPATIELIAYGPESRISGRITADLASNEFRQLDRIFNQMGFPLMYNGRVSVRVIGGSGRVAAYGSIIDNGTQDPTYVPAQ